MSASRIALPRKIKLFSDERRKLLRDAAQVLKPSPTLCAELFLLPHNRLRRTLCRLANVT
jgi:hypothetical protein